MLRARTADYLPRKFETCTRSRYSIAGLHSGRLTVTVSPCTTIWATRGQAPEIETAGACTINRPCAQQYAGKSQSCMVISGRLIGHAPVLNVRLTSAGSVAMGGAAQSAHCPAMISAGICELSNPTF